MTIRWDWIAGNLDEIAAATLDHLQLTLIAVGVGFAFSLVLGLAAYRWRRLYGPIAGTAGLLYTIPSLALFAVLVPFTGLTVLTAEIGLVSYTLLILVRGIVSGLDAVPRDAVEAATDEAFASACAGDQAMSALRDSEAAQAYFATCFFSACAARL